MAKLPDPSSLSPDAKAILVTARSVNQAYEWVSHARIGKKEGLPDGTPLPF